MPKYEYKVVPAPVRTLPKKDVNLGADPAAFTFESILNEAAYSGWEFYKRECMPLERRKIFGTVKEMHEMLIFRRAPIGAKPELVDEHDPVSEIERARKRRVKRPDLLGATLAGRRLVTNPEYVTAAE